MKNPPPWVPVTATGWRIDKLVRAEALAAHDFGSLLDDPGLKRITDFAAALCEAPISLVSLIDGEKQTFLARTGYDAPESSAEDSIAITAMAGNGIMVVSDCARDPRFSDNPHVKGPPYLRFYAGVPLVSDTDVPLGVLNVIDVEPRAGLTSLQYQGLMTLGEAVMARLRTSREAVTWRENENATHRALNESHARFRALADAMPQMIWSTLADGYHDYYNARWYEFTGRPDVIGDGQSWGDLFHPDEAERVVREWEAALDLGEPYHNRYRLRRADGVYRWMQARAMPLRDDNGMITRWFGTCTDIQDSQAAAEERELITQELSHRIKNIFAVISGLVGFAARGAPAFRPVAEALRERIMALSRAHDFVRPHSAQSRPAAAQNSLLGLLGELFRPYQDEGTSRIAVQGGDVEIDDRSATPLALLFHELATNATKFGALSTPDGKISLAILSGDTETLLTWTESGGPEVAGEPSPGFGSQLIEMSAVRQLGGTLARDWRAGGLVLTLSIPTAAFSRHSG